MRCKEDSSAAIGYFFFDSRDAQEGLQQHEGFIRSLIKQFALQCSVIPDALVQLYGKGYSWPSLKYLQDTLRNILAQFTHAYVIADSLDECSDNSAIPDQSSERTRVLNWMKDLTCWQEFTRNVHVLITSRKELSIERALQSLKAVEVCMEGDPIRRDIQEYIDNKLLTDGQLRFWKGKAKEIRAKVLEMSDGMCVRAFEFLLFVLTMLRHI